MRLSLRKAQSMLRRTTSMWIVPRRHSADALQFRSSMAIRSRSRCCVSGVTVSARPSSHMPKRSMTMTRSRTIFVRRFRRQTSLRIGLGICSRICEMQSDGRPKKRCVHGSPSTGYQAPDSQIPARHRVPKGYAFLSVCAKPVRGLRQTWHGLSPNSIDPYRLGEDRYRICLLLAQSVSLRGARTCPELGVKPTCRLNARTSQFDPFPTCA